ncbi:MAG: DUF1343 domain-containing protein [Bacteroidales bacterium]|nr:DUF1343 domain-containing protein [Bacteroidales bacterium]MBN2817466.1 DUF1343 domain-containing protein [Bacteroidales bacterium]
MKICSNFAFFILLINQACSNAQIPKEKNVLPGIYQIQLLSEQIQGKNMAVVANYGSIIENTHIVDTLLKMGMSVQTIFSPEHGFTGNFEAGADVSDSDDSNLAVPIVSLYGSKQKPEVEDLTGLDIIIFDLQDVGVRFYTYISTLHYVMQACAENNISLIVLDRPNPNARYVDGPVLDKNFTSFIGMHQVPVVYGMTIGEYAQMINGEGWLGDGLKCDLSVILNQNYSHTTPYNLPVKPSPNLPNMRSVYLYPSLCFFEGTIVSIGRGTDFPFQVFGHPDFSRKEFSFMPESKPGASLNPKLKDQICYGVDLREFPLDSLQMQNNLNLNYLRIMFEDLNQGEDFFTSYFDLLAGTDKFRKDILAGKSFESIQKSWSVELESFKIIRAKYLLYP